MGLTAAERFAGFRIIRPLGAGGMGEVYLVEHPRLPRLEALKVRASELSLDAEYRQRFAREADLAAKLWHPHISVNSVRQDHPHEHRGGARHDVFHTAYVDLSCH